MTDYYLPIIWPDHQIQIPHTSWRLPLGHAGVVIIDGSTGSIRYADFGRYFEEQGGAVRYYEVAVTIDQTQPLVSAHNLTQILEAVGKYGSHQLITSVFSVPDGSFETADAWIEAALNDGNFGTYDWTRGIHCYGFVGAVGREIGIDIDALDGSSPIPSMAGEVLAATQGGFEFDGGALRPIDQIDQYVDENAWIAPCFSASTPILLADGTSIAIEDIRVGLRVAAFDECEAAGTAKLTSGLVARLIPGITTEWIVLEDGTRVTPGHRYLRPDGSFLAIGDIVAGDGLVVDAAGHVTRVTGTLMRAIDAASDATWITPEAQAQIWSLGLRAAQVP